MACAFLAAAGAGASGGQDALRRTASPVTAAPNAHLVKAAFLYNFAKFTEWPDTAFSDARTPLALCVIGEDPFGPALDALGRKTIGQRPLAIHRVSGLDAVKACHLLYVSESEGARLEAILVALDGRPVLTVGEHEAFARLGGIIRLKVIDDKIRFEVNLDAARRAGLVLSSKLLRLAEIVETAEG